MIKGIMITGIAYEVDEPTRKYVIKRIGRLERYLPRHARNSISAEVKLKQVNNNHGNKYEAEVILSLPHDLLTAKDSTSNMLAAIDIVEAKIRTQLHTYKQANISHIGKRRLLSRFKRSFNREL